MLRGYGRLLTRSRSTTATARVSRTVVFLGLTSLLTDISSEMVVTVLPPYLVYVGGFSPLARSSCSTARAKASSGPLVAFTMFALAPVAFNSIFLLSFCSRCSAWPSSCSSSTQCCQPDAAELTRRYSLGGASPRAPPSLPRIARRRRRAQPGLASDAFIFLAVQQQIGLENSMFPLLFVGSASTYRRRGAAVRPARAPAGPRPARDALRPLGASAPRSCSPSPSPR